MHSNQEKSIVGNIFTLTKKTQNVSLLAEQLTANGVFTAEEKEKILFSHDEESQCNLLYETILRKPPASFAILIDGLRSTGNGSLANLLEESLRLPDTPTKLKLRKQSQLTKRVSCSDFYENVLGNKPVSGKEMGIAELLEDSIPLRTNWQLLAKLLELDSESKIYERCSQDFVVRATILLRDWVTVNKRLATLDKLTGILNGRNIFECAARIRKMFERSDSFDEKWEDQDNNQFPISVSGREKQIVDVLDDNPSFCLHIERLFLMLNIPMEFFKLYASASGFQKHAVAILKLWKDINARGATIQNLATLLVQNGHPYTAEKIRMLHVR